MAAEVSAVPQRPHIASGDAGATAPRWLPGFVLLGMVSVMAFVVLSGFGFRPDITQSATALTVAAKGYERTIPFTEIDSVTLRRTLDGVGRRRNALQSGNTYAGKFEMRPFGTAMLFVDAANPPFVVVHARDGVLIVSARDSAAAMLLASELRRAASVAHAAAQLPR
jgi:hypothetical protein